MDYKEKKFPCIKSAADIHLQVNTFVCMEKKLIMFQVLKKKILLCDYVKFWKLPLS